MKLIVPLLILVGTLSARSFAAPPCEGLPPIWAGAVHEDSRGWFGANCSGVLDAWDGTNILGVPDWVGDSGFTSLGNQRGNFITVDLGMIVNTCALQLYQVGVGTGPGAEREAFSVWAGVDGSNFTFLAMVPDQTTGTGGGVNWNILEVLVPAELSSIRYVRLRQEYDDPL